MSVEIPELSRSSFCFLAALARSSAVIIPLGAPGLHRVAPAPKIVLAVLLAAILWPQMNGSSMEPLWNRWLRSPLSTSVAVVATELMLGVCSGLVVSLMIESIAWAMSLVGVNAGYQFASTFDPNSEADSAVLPVLGQLLGGLLFFASGLYRHMILVLAAPGAGLEPGWLASGEFTRVLSHAGSQLFVLSLRLALPMVGLLVLIDLGVAVMNRIHAHLNLISITFPAKMLLTLALVISLAGGWATLVQREAATWSRQLVERSLAQGKRKG
jgi:flagellar biosynthetic protein FliR